MAKTRADYVSDGIAMFAERKTRPEGDSWQTKAMGYGWNTAFLKRFKETLIVPPPAQTDNRLNGLRAVKAHIKHLEILAYFEKFASPKFHRYVNKIQKLETKHGLTLK